jgi:hypothetical protein
MNLFDTLVSDVGLAGDRSSGAGRGQRIRTSPPDVLLLGLPAGMTIQSLKLIRNVVSVLRPPPAADAATGSARTGAPR